MNFLARKDYLPVSALLFTTKMRIPSENQFFIGTAIWFLLTVFWGFAPSFYLSNLFENSGPLPIHLIVHGIVFSIWNLLYAVQVFLIRSKNFKLHRTLGIFGLFVMIAMVPTGIYPSIYKVYAGTTTLDAAGHNVFRLASGYCLFAFAFIYRKKGFYHKRLMLGCMVMLMSAAIFRISFDFNMQDSQVFNKGFQIFPVVMLFLFDLIKYKKAVLVDLIPVVIVFSILFFADYFWLSPMGEAFMGFLISIFVEPFTPTLAYL